MSYKIIEIVPYNPEWPHWFELVKLQLSNCIGDLALSIDHIGSTSVPGLGAKNRIDIQVTVEEISLKAKESIDRSLKMIGFGEVQVSRDHRPTFDIHSEDHWQKFYLTITKETLDFSFNSNIHFRAKGKANQIYPLLFRDYLRSHPSAAAAYQDIKEKLVLYHPHNIDAYCEIKDPACDLIMSAAQDWAKQISWSPLI